MRFIEDAPTTTIYAMWSVHFLRSHYGDQFKGRMPERSIMIADLLSKGLYSY